MITIKKISSGAIATVDKKGLANMEYAGLVGGKNPQYTIVEEATKQTAPAPLPQAISKEYEQVQERIITNESESEEAL